MLAVLPNGKWASFENAMIVARQNGKGAVLEARSLAGLYLFGEQLILWSAHEYKTAMEAFRRVRALVDNTDDLRRRVRRIVNTNGEEQIELTTGQRLRFIARSKGAGRGFTVDTALWDEAFALTSQQQTAQMPTMSARPNPQIIYASSPPLDSASGEVLFSVRRRADEGSDPRLCYLDWGAPGVLTALDDVDLDDRELWRVTNPAYNVRVMDEFIERERAAMTREGFARERLGIWPPAPGVGGVIDAELWRSLADRQSRLGSRVAFAVDVTPSRDYAAIAAYGVRDDDVGHVEVVEHRPGTDWVVPRLVQLRTRWNPVAIGLDAGGPANSLMIDLDKAGIAFPEESDKHRHGDLAVPSTRDVAAGCGAFVDAARQKIFRHLDQASLNVALAGAVTRPVADAWAWGRKVSTVDISPLCAATLARWAYEARQPVAPEQFFAMWR